MQILDFIAANAPFLIGLALGIALGAVLTSAAGHLLDWLAPPPPRPLPPPYDGPERRRWRPNYSDTRPRGGNR